jgi:signal transduction histidine kinase
MRLLSLPGTRRLWPRRMRTRLAVFYFLLFLLAGTALLAVTYLVVQHIVQPAPAIPVKDITRKLVLRLAQCKPLPTTPAADATCNRLLLKLNGGRHDTFATLRHVWLITFGVLVVAAGGLSWMASGRALRPIRKITEAARQASELRLGQRLALAGPDDEFKQLADTFDTMLERLDAAFTSQKRFMANAAHELRTPLTAMRTAIDVTLSKPRRTSAQLEAMAERVRHAVERSEAIVEALLTLASSEAGRTNLETVDLATAAEDALDAAGAAIAERRIVVNASLAPASARGDRVLVERMIANLVDNAVRHNVPGGSIAIRTAVEDGQATFEISNTGRELSEAEIPELFEPFARAKRRVEHADGVGLGLSIAVAIARAHNASLTAQPRAGGGLDVSVAIQPQTR